MFERFKKLITFIFGKPWIYICASFIALIFILFGCQGLMNVNGHDNNVIVEDSFKGGSNET